MDAHCDNCKQPAASGNAVWGCRHAHEWVRTRAVNGLTYVLERGSRQVFWCKKCLDDAGYSGAAAGEFAVWARCPVCGKHMQPFG